MKDEGGLAKWRRVLLKPFWLVTLVAALLMLCTYLSVRIDPNAFWPLALLGMLYPYLLALHAALIAWWLVFKPKRALVPMVVLLIGWGHIWENVQLFGRSSPREHQGQAIKMLSWNVRLFDFYNWSHNKETRNMILDVMARESADIMCLQEYITTDAPIIFLDKDTLVTSFNYKYLHDAYTHHSRKGVHFGIATFSRWPIVDTGTISFPDNLNNLCIWSDIAVFEDTLRVYNAHLASIRFGDEDYRFMQELNTDTDGETIKRGGRRIIARLRDAFLRRADEVKRIKAHMAESPHPVVYAGDLNDTPMSYSYRTLRHGLTDAFVSSGRGVGNTYIGLFPSFRIDHILHGPELVSWAFRTHPEKLSDHHAISCMMGRKP